MLSSLCQLKVREIHITDLFIQQIFVKYFTNVFENKYLS